MRHAKLRALVVDDNPDHALLMENALRDALGAEARSCHSAQTALDHIGTQSPDVVVLDYRLPDAEGWDALTAIRDSADVPIVIVTGQGNELAAAEAIKAGAEDYIPKQGDYLRALPAAVLRAVETHRRRRSELTRLNKTSQALAACREFESVVNAALDGVQELLQPDAAWLLLPNPSGALELVGARGISPEAVRNPQSRFASRGSAPVNVQRQNRPGFLCAGAERPGCFGSHHQEILSTIAGQTASAIQNAQLFASLSRAKAQWERTFDSISDPILISDTHLRVIRLNRAAARCLNVPLREAAGRACHRVLLGSNQPCPWHDALLHGVAVSSDRYLSHLQRWFCFSAFPFEDGEGRHVGVVHILRDVTEERHLRRQMAQAQKLAALGELVAGVAHELNNPLTGILGFSHLLLRKDPDAAFREDLEKIAGEARRAARIVRNLAAFARQPACADISRQLVDVNAVLSKTLDLRSYQLRAAGVEVALDLAHDLPRALTDPDELQQVFLNIVNNAEQAMTHQQSARRLTIRTLRGQTGGVRIEFRDTGPGLPEEALDRIFDPFFTTKEPNRGTGLGLSVCYGIVRGHGGRISAANHPDGGAVFTIDLSGGEGSPTVDPSDAEPEACPAVPPARILVVDDEPVVAAFVQRTLAEDGHRVDVSQQGRTALAKLESGTYDLIVCDLKLPDMSGCQVYQEALAAYPAMRGRFIFLTGDTLGPDTAEFLRGRPGPWLEKPLMPEDLKHLVNHHLASRMPANE